MVCRDYFIGMLLIGGGDTKSSDVAGKMPTSSRERTREILKGATRSQKILKEAEEGTST